MSKPHFVVIMDDFEEGDTGPVATPENPCNPRVPCIHFSTTCFYSRQAEQMHVRGKDATDDMAEFLKRLRKKDATLAAQLEAILRFPGEEATA